MLFSEFVDHSITAAARRQKSLNNYGTYVKSKARYIVGAKPRPLKSIKRRIGKSITPIWNKRTQGFNADVLKNRRARLRQTKSNTLYNKGMRKFHHLSKKP